MKTTSSTFRVVLRVFAVLALAALVFCACSHSTKGHYASDKGGTVATANVSTKTTSTSNAGKSTSTTHSYSTSTSTKSSSTKKGSSNDDFYIVESGYDDANGKGYKGADGNYYYKDYDGSYMVTDGRGTAVKDSNGDGEPDYYTVDSGKTWYRY